MHHMKLTRLGVSGNFSPFVSAPPGQSVTEAGTVATANPDYEAAETSKTVGSMLLAVALAAAGSWVGIAVGSDPKAGTFKRLAGWTIGGLSVVTGGKVVLDGAKKLVGA